MAKFDDDPFDAFRRKAMDDFPEFFAEFEKEFARMQGMVNKIMEDAVKHAQSPQRGEPFVYGADLEEVLRAEIDAERRGERATDPPGTMTPDPVMIW